jgi:hypothetical protein
MDSEQAYLEKMFPNGKELPVNRLIPCLLLQGRRTEVVFLYKAASEDADLLATEHDKRLEQSDISVSAAGAEQGGHADLRIGMELVYPERTVRFHGTISDPEGKKQAAVAKALLLVNRVALFVATHEFRFVSFKAYNWNPASQPTLENILRATSHDDEQPEAPSAIH